MTNRLDELIEQTKKDGMDDLTAALMAKKAELGDEPSEEEVDAAIHEALMAQLTGLMPGIQESADPEYMDKAVNTIKGIFDEQGWHYSPRTVRPDVTVFELGFTINKTNVRIRVYVEDMPKVCRIDAILPITAEEVYAYPLCKTLVKINYPKRFGAFHYDDSDGELTYRYSFPIGHGLYKDDFMMAFRAVLHSAVDDDDYPEIKKCATGKFKNRDKNEILNNVNNLVDDITD